MTRLLLLLAALSLAGCSAQGSGSLRVCAAASLRGAFEAIAAAFAKDHPGAEVALNFAGSQTLRTQIEAGAPCHVIATADEATMQALVESRRVASPERFASNALAIIVPAANPAGLASWRDLARAPRIALAAPEVPIGAYARRFIARADALEPGLAAAVTAHTRTFELDVAHVLARVRQGEVDAAIVYRTDALSDGVASIPIPDALDVPADYPIARVAGAPDAAIADAFIAFVLGPGRGLLARRGFGPPRPVAP